MAVSKRLRYEVLRRDNHACRYCGATAPDVKLTVDHVTPTALGGADTADNLVAACSDCNSGKTSSVPDAPLVADVSSDALRWAAAVEQAAANMLQQEQPKLEYRAAFQAQWDRWGLGEGESRKSVPLPEDWKPSIERFRVAGLPEWVWADIVDIGMLNKKVSSENTFRYCCGIAWNRVTGLQQEARRVVTGVADTCVEPPRRGSLIDAAITVWAEEMGRQPTAEEAATLGVTVTQSREAGQSAHRVLEGAQYAAWFGFSSIAEGLASLQHDEAVNRSLWMWQLAWLATANQYPSAEECAALTSNCKDLYKAGFRSLDLQVAAAVAGASLSLEPTHGLTSEDSGALLDALPSES